MSILRTIKRMFLGPDESYILMRQILDDLKFLDHSKWQSSKVRYGNLKAEFDPDLPQPYGYYKTDINGNAIEDEQGRLVDEDDDALVSDIYYKEHPDLSYRWYNGPFTAYPDTDRFDINALLPEDRKKIFQKFRKLVYK